MDTTLSVPEQAPQLVPQGKVTGTINFPVLQSGFKISGVLPVPADFGLVAAMSFVLTKIPDHAQLQVSRISLGVGANKIAEKAVLAEVGEVADVAILHKGNPLSSGSSGGMGDPLNGVCT